VLVEHLAAAGHFESLLGPGFCFDFGHLALLCGSTMPLRSLADRGCSFELLLIVAPSPRQP
jgi:hypothetical protein